MEKGFNDDELADIMNEIESLEKEFTEEVDTKPTAVEEVAEIPAEAVEEPVMEQAEEVVETQVVEEPQAVEEPVAAAESFEEESFEEESFEEESFEEENFEEESFEEGSFEDDLLDSKPVLDNIDPMPQEAPQEEIAAEVAPTMEHDVETPVTHTEREVLAEVVEKPVEEVVSVHTEPVESASVHHMERTHQEHHAVAKPVTGESAHTSMSFNIEGDMKLSLSFNIAGKVVELAVNDNGLELELDGGMKFSVPLDGQHTGKKAA